MQRPFLLIRHRLAHKGWQRPTLVFIFLLALLLRVLRLDFQPLWWDEGYSVWFAGQPLSDMVRLTAADIHPPLYYALLHLWTRAWGLSPLALRSFSVLMGVPAVLLAYALGRTLRGRNVGLLAAALVALNPFAIYYSQEIRMYGLAATFSLAALWSGWHWARDAAGPDHWRWGVVYALSVVAGMYTLYMFALIPLAQSVWVLIDARKRWRAWLSALVAAGLLYVPWLLYAGPRLLNYVAYKVVKDNDTPLPLLSYIGHHLSAFLVGHLEGPWKALWPWPLLVLLPLLAGWIAGRRHFPKGQAVALRYLLITLGVALAVGFAQQLQAPFIPERFERLLLIAAPALWLLLALGLHMLWQQVPAAACVTAGLLLFMQGASLWGFYQIPRYADRDYRPLIATVQQNVAEGDSVFTVFPWQIGYFWAYWSADTRPPIVASPGEAWGPEVARALDARLATGAVWFPEHLALGGLLESAAEDYLHTRSYQLLNQWYGAETRLTAWSLPTEAEPALTMSDPIEWQSGMTLLSAQAQRRDRRLYWDLTWDGVSTTPGQDLTFSLWLTGPAGYRWAQRDVTPWQDAGRIVLNSPVGTPPGEYDVWAAMVDARGKAVPLAGDNPALQAWLGTVQLPVMTPGPAAIPAQFPASVSGNGWHFAGHSQSDGPYLPGDDVQLSLFWQADAPPAVDYFVFVQLLDKDGKVVAGLEEPPLAWLPTSAWPLGTPLRSQHRLRLPADLPAGRYRLIAGLFDRQSGLRVRWEGDDFLLLGYLRSQSSEHDFTIPHPQVPLNLTLVGGHRLVGYDLVAGASEGSPVNLTLYWVAAGATDRRYSSFVHLLDAQDRLRGQTDAEPAHGAHPTTSWLAGEVIRDAHTLNLPVTDPAPPYYLTLGLYDPRTGERLPFVDAQGNIIADHITLPLQP